MLITLIIVILTSLLPVNGDSSGIISAPIFYECGANKFPYSTGHCVSDCKGTYVSDDEWVVTLYQSIAEEEILYGTCKRIRRETVLVKTWTFSVLPPVVEHKSLSVSREGCLYHWEHACGKSKCSNSEPPLPNDYSWATERKIVQEYFLIDVSLNLRTMKLNNDLWISTSHGLVNYTDGVSISPDGLTGYVWEVRDVEKVVCDMKVAAVLRCTSTNKKGKILCPSIGMEFSVDSKMHHHECNITLHEMSGKLFTYQKEKRPETIGLIELDNNQALFRVLESIITKLKYSESAKCFRDCLTLNHAGNGSIFHINGNMLKKFNETHMVSCAVEPICKIDLPLTVCRGTAKIRVECGTHQKWWDSSSGLELTDSNCVPSVLENSRMVIVTGGESMVLNESGIFWEQSSLSDQNQVKIMDYHKTINVHSVLKEIKHIDQAGVSPRVVTLEDSITSRQNIWTDILDYASKIYNGLLQKIGSIVVIISISMTLIWGVKSYFNSRYRGFSIAPTTISHPPRDLIVHE